MKYNYTIVRLRTVPLFKLSPSREGKKIDEKNKSAPREHWGEPESRGKKRDYSVQTKPESSTLRG